MTIVIAPAYARDYISQNITSSKYNPSTGQIRLVHLSSNAPAVDLAIKEGQTLVSDVSYKETSKYVPINAGNYTLDIKVSGTNAVAIEKPNVSLQNGASYTVYVVGLLSDNPPLEAIVQKDTQTNASPSSTPAPSASPNAYVPSDDFDRKEEKKELKEERKAEKAEQKALLKSESQDGDNDDEDEEDDDDGQDD